MSKERKSFRETFKIAFAEGMLEFDKLYLDSSRYLRSRKGAVTIGAISGAGFAFGDWELATVIAGISILYKAGIIREGEDKYEARLKEEIEKEEIRLKELTTDSDRT